MRSTRVILGLALICALAPRAMAGSEPGTRLVSCHGQSCLLVSGRRGDPASAILINGHEVAVAGQRNWSARLPLDTLRQWAPPFARTIEVAVEGAPDATVALPIGLLGHTTDLASLEVRSR